MVKNASVASLVLLILSAVVLETSKSDEHPPKSTIRVAGIVLKWVRGNKEANYRRAEPMIREAAT